MVVLLLQFFLFLFFFFIVVVFVGVGWLVCLHVGVRVFVMIFFVANISRCGFVASLGAWALNPGALKKKTRV